MTHKTEINKSEFDLLLSWLNTTGVDAAQKYESIRSRLIQIFQTRGCFVAEELADETIDRVAKKVSSLIGSYEGDPALYFYAVSKNLFLEYLRRPKYAELPSGLRVPEADDQDDDPYHDCLEKCMTTMEPGQCELITKYYAGEKRAKIDHRKDLQESFGITAEALRLRALRIRMILQKCVIGCVKKMSA